MTQFTKEDMGILLISFVIAVALWMNVAIGRQESIAEKQILGIKTHIQGQIARYHYRISPQSVDIRLQGTPKSLSKIGPGDISVSLDIANLGEGHWRVSPVGNVSNSSPVRIVEILPEMIDVTISSKPDNTTE